MTPAANKPALDRRPSACLSYAPLPIIAGAGAAAENAVVFLRKPDVYGPAQKLGRFIIPPRRTALLELYAPGPNRLDARGFVVLRLPTKPMVSGGLRSVPQSDHPVQVMLD